MIQHQKQHVVSHIFFICFPKNKFKNTTIFFLMLKAKQPKSRATMDFSSIKLSKETEIPFFFFQFQINENGRILNCHLTTNDL